MESYFKHNERYRPSISEWSSHPAERLYSNINHIIPNLNLDLDDATKIIFDKSNQAEDYLFKSSFSTFLQFILLLWIFKLCYIFL